MATEVKVVITGAAGQIAYSLIPMIANGDMFGPNQRVALRLLDLDIPAILENLRGTTMEIEDGCYPLVADVLVTADPAQAFADADYTLLVGSFPRKEGMERKDLMAKNISIFKSMGESIEKYASSNCRVLVVGNPANTNCLVCSHFAPKIPKTNFTALTRLDHNRAVGQLAKLAKVPMSEVTGLVIWGNHSSTQYPDLRNAKIKGVPAMQVLADHQAYLDSDYIKLIQTRGAEIINARKASSAMSAARGIVCHVRDWFQGAEGVVSMGIITEANEYQVGAGLCYSLPCRMLGGGQYEVVPGYTIDEFSRQKMSATEAELKEEKTLAFDLLSQA